MPNLETEHMDFAGSIVFAAIYFCSGYWQLSTDPESYDACGTITPFGVFSSTRVLQGLMNAVAHFQSSVEPLFAELRKNLKAWIDDLRTMTQPITADELCQFLHCYRWMKTTIQDFTKTITPLVTSLEKAYKI